MAQTLRSIAIGIAALFVVVLSLVMLERQRAGLTISALDVGTTPATLYQDPAADGPVVVVAHGFAGSRQIMQAYSLALAQAGYRVVAFDFEGHGRNPVPMSDDVGSLDGTTALLVDQTLKVIAAARALPEVTGVSLLGHSMGTDVIVRAALAEQEAGREIDAVVAVSMYSEAVTATFPERLLVISGQFEPFLRDAAMEAVQLVAPEAEEGETVRDGDTVRRAVAAPWVEHVGVLFSPTAVDAAQDWLAATYGRDDPDPAPYMGLWILALLGGIVIAFRPVAARLPAAPPPPPLPARRFVLAAILPAVAVPVLVTPFYGNFLPVLVADYLMIHLALYGVLQLILLGRARALGGGLHAGAVGALAVWGILIFGLALDRYAASFWPTPGRLAIAALLAIGTVPFMLGDASVTEAGRAALWRRILARAMFFVSLGLAAYLDPGELAFVLVILPVFALFFVVHGLMGRWVARRSGGLPAGLGLGLCLAWALGVSFPLFA